RAGVGFGRGDGLGAEPVDELFGGVVLGAGGGDGLDDGGVAGRVGLGGGREAHAGGGGDRGGDVAERAVRVGGAGQVDGDEQRPVEPGAESFGEQVVRTTGGGVGGLVAGV